MKNSTMKEKTKSLRPFDSAPKSSDAPKGGYLGKKLKEGRGSSPSLGLFGKSAGKKSGKGSGIQV
jgi:hypothetical protein